MLLVNFQSTAFIKENGEIVNYNNEVEVESIEEAADILRNGIVMIDPESGTGFIPLIFEIVQ